MIVVFFLEEPSAKALLEGLLPRLLPATEFRYTEFRYVVFEGKQDLERNLVRKLRGWLLPDTRFVVLRDQDGADCRRVKQQLAALVAESEREALVRVACRELESWILGDLPALAEAFGVPRVRAHATKAKFRDPDSLGRPVSEIRRIVPNYQKIDGARRVGIRLDPGASSSTSFRVFCAGVRRLVGDA